MHRSIEENLEKLQVLCQQHHVKELSLFGSATGPDFNSETSDLDFLVSFQPMNPAEHADAWFGLQEDLEALFNRSVDLIESKPLTNPYFLQSLKETQVQLYAAA